VRTRCGSMSLSPSCKSVSKPNLLSELEKVPVWWEDFCGSSDPRGMVHLDDARKLSDSAATGCSLCCLIVDVVLQKLYQPRSITTTITSARSKQSRGQRYDPLLRGELIDEPIYLRPNYDPLKPSFPEAGAANAWHVRGFQVGLIRLFATQGKAIQCVFCLCWLS
jgi:hypothetical protein